jgi:hypothetical protein
MPRVRFERMTSVSERTNTVHALDRVVTVISAFTLYVKLIIREFIHQWIYSPLLGPGLFFSFIIFFTQTVELLGWGSARRKAATCIQNTKNKEYTHRHPCLQWDSNP